MAINYRTSLKTTRMQAVVTDIGTSGKLKLLTAANAVIVSIPLSTTAGNVSGVVLTFSGTPLSAVASLAGTNVATKAIVTTNSDVTVVDGLTVGTATDQGVDVVLNSTSITAGQTVTITSATISHG